MILHPDVPFYPIPGSEPQSTFGAVVEILLKTRSKLSLESCHERYEEDVNAYLAGLLVSYINPEYLLAISEAVSRYDMDVHHAVAQAQDKVHVYWIYKVNADDLLVSLGVFHRLWQEAQGQVTKLKRYYSNASEYQRRIYGKVTTVGQIQSKLAEQPERYLTILHEVRRDYLHFIDHLHSEELDDFKRQMEEFAWEMPIQEKRDEFLDAYLAWVRAKQDKELRIKLILSIEQLKKMDPQFKPDSLLSQLNDP